MTDPTESFRRKRVAELLAAQSDNRSELEARYGQVWSTTELRQQFVVLGFMAPYVVVKEMLTGRKASMEFQHEPRLYFNLQYDE